MPPTETATPVSVPQRLRLGHSQPGIYKRLVELSGAVDAAGLEESLSDLIKVRVSQVNGCAYCLEMHTREARDHGEREQRLYALDAWREASVFTARERAALALAESVTLVTEGHVPDDVWSAAEEHFDQKERGALVSAIGMMNFWNRIAIAGRLTPGS